MSLSFNYSVSARDVMRHPQIADRLKMMKKAGVEHLWLYGYFYGRHESAPEELEKARKRLLDEGFQTGVISLPVGHPGNSLNPDDPTLELAIHPEWQYRVGPDGKKEYFCACINEKMIRHNREAALMYARMGFDRHFFDDDLRLGNWGDQVRGCFCDDCICRFNEKTGLRLTREEIAKACSCADNDICNAWIRFSCDKLTGFMRETAVPGMRSGIMIMHGGGPKHGISIPDIKNAVPDCLFRVGELHFDDRSYTAPGGRESLCASVREHLRLIGTNTAYSESTVFPAGALSPANLLDKIRLEISLGLRNIFLMSGTWFLSEPYWNTIAAAKCELSDYARSFD